MAKQLFRIFKKENENMGYKVVNMLEVFTALILLADFSQSGEVKATEEEAKLGLNADTSVTHASAAEKLQARADMIEHKVNLLVLLFTFRGDSSLNISEIIIMGKTAINALARVFPSVQLFKTQQI